jgi:DNA ligase (NAD+)
VNISGASIARATLHNYEEVESLDVRIWDTVFIKRAWEVIPKILSVIVEGRKEWAEPLLPPELCPSCSTSVVKDDEKVRFYCPNASWCRAQISEQLAFAVGKQWFNIDGFWERQVEIFLQEWIIHDLVDVFQVADRADDILELEWFKEKSVQNLVEAVEWAKQVKINELLTSLWISWVGKKTAKTLSKLFAWEEDLLDFKYSLEDLEALDDVWPEIGYNVIEYFSDDKNKDLLSRLVKVLEIEFVQPQIIPEGERWEFFEKKMCITGSFENYKRDDLVKILEENGWDFMSSVTKKTDFLLAWEKAWSKLSKANDLWVEILSVEEFLERVDG